MKPDKDPFSELLDSVLDGTASDARRAELAKRVEQDESLVGEIVEQLRVHSLLQWQCGVPSEDEAPQQRHTILRHPTGWVQSIVRRWRWAAAIALFAGGAGIFALALHRAENRSVAEIVDESGVIWSSENAALVHGNRIVPGQLSMLAGELTLRFRSGATVSATGNVSMRIVSDMLVLLDRGQATAHVPQWAKGFTIKTRAAEVIDLGTKFGVMARDGGATDVVVFEGEVDLKATSNATAGLKRLTQGEGARVENTGAIDRIVEIGRNSDGDRWSSEAPTGGDSVFKSVRDNMHAADGTKYYAIVPHGLADDALAYVDRPHEWNGLTAQGLPRFLQQADYIRTFNTTRFVPSMEIVVEMAKDAEVYIFFDSRIRPPGWLIDGFEDTNVEVGLDEGPWTPEDTEHVVGVSGGQSIDNIFSVWRRRCKAGEHLVLGPLDKNRQEPKCAMYGIAGRPVD